MIRSLGDKTPKVAPTAFVSEAAYVVGDVEIGENSSVWPGAVVRGDFGKITIGSNCAIEDTAVIHSGAPSTIIADVSIGNEVHIGHGAVINGRRIGNNVLVGMNATVLHDAEIGSNCIIGACCLVKEAMKVPDNSFVAGVPGEIKGPVTEKQSFWIKKAPQGYAGLAERYRAEGL